MLRNFMFLSLMQEFYSQSMYLADLLWPNVVIPVCTQNNIDVHAPLVYSTR